VGDKRLKEGKKRAKRGFLGKKRQKGATGTVAAKKYANRVRSTPK
jgi:hypothetical protein